MFSFQYVSFTAKVMGHQYSRSDTKTKLLHCRYACVKQRYPYFWNGLINCGPIKDQLSLKQKAHLAEMFALSSF